MAKDKQKDRLRGDLSSRASLRGGIREALGPLQRVHVGMFIPCDGRTLMHIVNERVGWIMARLREGFERTGGKHSVCTYNPGWISVNP